MHYAPNNASGAPVLHIKLTLVLTAAVEIEFLLSRHLYVYAELRRSHIDFGPAFMSASFACPSVRLLHHLLQKKRSVINRSCTLVRRLSVTESVHFSRLFVLQTT